MLFEAERRLMETNSSLTALNACFIFVELAIVFPSVGKNHRHLVTAKTLYFFINLWTFFDYTRCTSKFSRSDKTFHCNLPQQCYGLYIKCFI